MVYHIHILYPGIWRSSGIGKGSANVQPVIYLVGRHHIEFVQALVVRRKPLVAIDIELTQSAPVGVGNPAGELACELVEHYACTVVVAIATDDGIVHRILLVEDIQRAGLVLDLVIQPFAVDIDADIVLSVEELTLVAELEGVGNLGLVP